MNDASRPGEAAHEQRTQDDTATGGEPTVGVRPRDTSPTAVTAQAASGDTSREAAAVARLLVDMTAAMVAAEEDFIYPVHPLAARGFLTVLGGKHSSMKTWLMLLTGAAVHRGEPDVAGMPCAKSVTLYVDAENGACLMGKRFHAAGIPADGLLIADGTLLRLPENLPALKALIVGTAAGLVVLDSLRRLAPGVEENNSDKMAPLVAGIANLARELNVAIVLIHHQSSKEGAATLRGSSTIEDQADIVFVLERVKGDDDPWRRRLSCRKFRIGEEPGDTWFRLALGTEGSSLTGAEPYVNTGHGPSLSDALAGQLRALAPQVRVDGGWAPHKLAAAVGRSQDDWSFKQALKALEDGGEWVAEGTTRDRRWRPADPKLDSGGRPERPKRPNARNGREDAQNGPSDSFGRSTSLGAPPERPNQIGSSRIGRYRPNADALAVEIEPELADPAAPNHAPVKVEIEPTADVVITPQ